MLLLILIRGVITIKGKKTLLLLLFVLLGLSLTACGKKDQKVLIQGEIEDEEESELDENKTNSKKKAPEEVGEQYEKYDFKNLPTPEPIDPEELDSYYVRQLNERSKLAFAEIVRGAEERRDVVNLTKPISKAELQRIMNIIFIDTPEVFMLENRYSYETDSGGSVPSVNLYYGIGAEDQEDLRESFIQRLTNESNKIMDAEDQRKGVMEAISYYEGLAIFNPEREDLRDSIPISENFENDIIHQIPIVSYTDFGRTSYIGYYKYLAGLLRTSGIDAMVVVGEITNPSHYSEKGLMPYEYKDQVVKETVNGNKVDVDCDYNGLYAWMMVKINNQWSHVDLYMDKEFLSTVEKDVDRYAKDEIKSLLVLVDDYTISQSRVFYMNEYILGSTPFSTKKDFNSLYANGHYVPYQDNVSLEAFESGIIERIAFPRNNAGRYIYYQFGSRENFSEFLNNFDSLVEKFNLQNKDLIKDYKVLYDDELLFVIVYDTVLRRTR